MATSTYEQPLAQLLDAATRIGDALKLRYSPVVVRDHASAFRIADRTKAGTVMHGEGAYWVVCLADAGRLEAAGYEWAPRP